ARHCRARARGRLAGMSSAPATGIRPTAAAMPIARLLRNAHPIGGDMAQQHGRTVVALPLKDGGHDCAHDLATLQDYARSLAAILGCRCGGLYDPGAAYQGPLYF